MTNLFNHILLTIILGCTFVSCTTNKEVDLIVYNAKVYTVDSVFSQKEAFAVKGGIFVDMGTSEEIRSKYVAREVIDAEGNAIYPGFYDTHMHFLKLADRLEQVNLSSSTSYEDVITQLLSYQDQNPDKRWIIGHGWNQHLWEDNSFPTKDTLDKYFPETPVFLSHAEGHMALVNTSALRIAQLDTTRAVPGGMMAIDSAGNFTGILIDNAMSLVANHLPIPAEQALLSGLRKAQDLLFSVGLTSIVDAGLSVEELEHLKKFYQQDSLKIRNYAMLGGNLRDIERYIREGIYESERLTIRSIKLLADGTLSSRGALLLSPYSDDSLSRGFLTQSQQVLDDMIRKVSKTPFQVSTHAVGDSANRLVLDTYGKYLKNGNNKRWIIEHNHFVSPDDFLKFAQFTIIPSIQPSLAISEIHWAEKRLGTERLKIAYSYKKLLQQNGYLAIGSGFPIGNFTPLHSLYAAVTGIEDHEGNSTTNSPEEKTLTREEALRGMTIWAAFACFQEKKRGSIERGKDADFIILSNDILKVPTNELLSTETVRTVIAGETVFLKEE